jgi:Kef-type K+ transport system membrane component KefB
VSDLLQPHALALPPLAKFALRMLLIFGIPPLARRFRLPGEVGLLLSGVVIGPYVLGLFGAQHPIADFLAQLGQLLLVFVAGLGIDFTHIRQLQGRSIVFGLLTTGIPLLLGSIVGIIFGYPFIVSIVIGSLIASHTLLGSRIVARLGVNRIEPIVITIGATVLSDTLSLLVFAICVSTYERGFSLTALGAQLLQIVVFVPLVLIGMSRAGVYGLKRFEADEDAYFILMFAMMAVAGLLAQLVNRPGIVGAFLGGLALNEAVQDKPAKEKLEFFENSFFVPIFFIVTGFLIDPTSYKA